MRLSSRRGVQCGVAGDEQCSIEKGGQGDMTDWTDKMGKPGKRLTSIRHYLVDEAGDGTLFNRHGCIIVGTEGCSRFFILGLLDAANPDALALEIQTLRADLLADPLSSKLPPEATRAAQAKGQAGEFEITVARVLPEL